MDTDVLRNQYDPQLSDQEMREALSGIRRASARQKANRVAALAVAFVLGVGGTALVASRQGGERTQDLNVATSVPDTVPVPTTAAVRPALSRNDLAFGEGTIGIADFGAPEQATVDAVTQILGPPSSDETEPDFPEPVDFEFAPGDNPCRPDGSRWVSWNDDALSLWFIDGKLTSWAVSGGGFTVDGFGMDATVEEVEQHYDSVVYEDGAGSPYVVAGANENADAVVFYFDSDSRSLVSIQAGPTECGD